VNTQPVGWGTLLTPSEVAAILHVDPKTVTRWAQGGKIRYIRTPGGHRRYYYSEIVALMAEGNHRHKAQYLHHPWSSVAIDG
jgi:excisionase family DNA binding protein